MISAGRLAGGTTPPRFVFNALRPRPYFVGIRLIVHVGTATDDPALRQMTVCAVVKCIRTRLLLAVGAPHSADTLFAVKAASPSGPCGSTIRSSHNHGSRHEKSFVHLCCPIAELPRTMLFQQGPPENTKGPPAFERSRWVGWTMSVAQIVTRD